MPRQWFKLALTNFFIAACLGLLLRYAFVEEISWLHYRHIMHAHSHVAMLGWVHLALYALLIHYFLPTHLQAHRFYRWMFWVQQICVWGMLITFFLQGYAAGSIACTSLFVLINYVFIWRFIKDLRQHSIAGKMSKRFVIAALVWMIISTFALWAMAPIMLLKMQQSALYYASIQFYLHFQFNGWFIWAMLALAFRLFEQHKVLIPQSLVQKIFYLLGFSCLLTYVLAVTWSTPIPMLFWINSVGVGLQLIALYFFIAAIRPAYLQLKDRLGRWTRGLLYISFISFILKVLIQTAVIIPYLATVAYTIRNYVLGFLHLLLLGIMSCGILAFSSHNNWLEIRRGVGRLGVLIFLAGFVLTELLLFLQGTLFWAAWGFLPAYYELLLVVSVLLPLGLVLLLVRVFQTEKHL